MLVRSATAEDAPAMAGIYADAVLHGLGTFEETPPGPEEIGRRMQAVLASELPWLVAEAEGRMLGYAYASPFRPRAAYRYTAEDTVYVAPNAKGRGVGRALLAALIEACEARALRQLIAAIGDSGNAASIRLHEVCGFERVGLAPALGFKHGRWVDVVWMQRALGEGARSNPNSTGLDLGGGG